MHLVANRKGFIVLFSAIISALLALVVYGVILITRGVIAFNSNSLESMYAFYSADSATECVLYDENKTATGLEDGIQCNGALSFIDTGNGIYSGMVLDSTDSCADIKVIDTCGTYQGIPNVPLRESYARGINLCKMDAGLPVADDDYIGILERRLKATYVNPNGSCS